MTPTYKIRRPDCFALIALAGTCGLAAAEISGPDASQRLIDAMHIATAFQSPTSQINTGNYGFAYAQKWNPSVVKASSYTLHSGVDINTTDDCGRRVVAVGNGIVRFSGHGGSLWGGVILIHHRYWDATAQRYTDIASQYGHVAPLDSLHEGDQVTAGQHIGYIADIDTGRCTSFTGVANYGRFDVSWSPHLHFEMRPSTDAVANKWTTAASFQALSRCATILDASSACRLAAADAAGYTDPEAWITAHANVRAALPSAPVGLSAKVIGTTQADLSWTDNSNNELGFKVERKQGSDAWRRVATVASGVTRYSAARLTAGTSYSFRVLATNATGDSAPSNSVPVLIASGVAPAAPSNLVTSAAGASQISLVWSDKSNNETGFKIERKSGVGAYAQVGTAPADAVSWSSVGLAPSTLYSFRVRATNATGDSAYSNESSASTKVPVPVPPAAPSGLTAGPVRATLVNLSWTDASNNETGFTVERRLGAAGIWAAVAVLAANTSRWADAGVIAGRSYSYRVLASNSAGNSGYSNVLPISTPR